MNNSLLFNNIHYNKIIKKNMFEEHPNKNIFINIFILLIFIIILGLFLSYRYKCKQDMKNKTLSENISFLISLFLKNPEDIVSRLFLFFKKLGSFAYCMYLLYPPKSSSEPSPVYATVTYFFMASETIKFDSMDGRPKGNSICHKIFGSDLVKSEKSIKISV